MLKRPNTPILFVMIMAAAATGLAPAEARAASSQTPTSFADLYQNRHGIAAGSWTKIHAAVSSAAQPLPNIQTFVGPNTKPTDKTTKSDLQGLFNYFPNDGFIKNVDVIFFNKKDVKWATDKATTLMGPSEVTKEIAFKGGPQNGGQQAEPRNTTIGQPCSNEGDRTIVDRVTYQCGKDNSASDVWEAPCDPTQTAIYRISGVPGKCTVTPTGPAIWVFPASLIASLAAPAPAPAQPSPLIFCWDGDPNGCESSDAWVGADGTAYLGIGVPNHAQTNDNPGYKGEAVSLYYAMWLSSYVKNNSIAPLTPDDASKNLTNSNFPPYWMYNADEYLTYAIAAAGGSANALENSIKNNADGAVDMVKHNDGGIAKTFGKTFNLAWINNFLDIKNMSTTWRGMDMMGNIGFSFGPRVMQTLIAVKGPAVMFDLTNLMSQGSTFDQAFQKEFGVSWMTAEPTIAKTIWDEYQGKY